MSPIPSPTPLDAVERRWAVVVPLVIAIGGAAVLAATAGDGGPAPATGAPIAGALGWLTTAIAADDGRALGWVAAALVAIAAGLLAATIAAARPGWPGRLGGAVAAIWFLACPPTRELAATLTPATVALPALAGLLLAFDRVARGGGGIAGRATGVAAVTAVLVDNRAWPAVLVALALVLYRARRGARWGGDAAIAAGVAALVWIGLAALAGGPVSPTAAVRLDEAGRALDRLGPLAIALAAAGVIAALGRRGDRWRLVIVVAIAGAAVPLTAPLAPGAMIAIGAGAGLAVAELAGRAPRPSHQIAAAASVLVMMIGSVVPL